MDSKLLNAVMGAYIKCSRPELAVQVFHNFTAARGEQAGEAGVDSAGEKDRGLNVDASDFLMAEVASEASSSGIGFGHGVPQGNECTQSFQRRLKNRK